MHIVTRIALAALLIVGLTPSAHAITTIYTDRTAFEAAAGAATVLTLDNPAVVADVPHGRIHVTYDNLVQFNLDLNLYLGGPTPGTISTGDASLWWNAVTLVPVTAFGFDIVKADPNAHLGVSGILGLQNVDGLTFVGVVSTDPFIGGLGFGGGCHILGNLSCRVEFDNITLTTVPTPEPAYWLSLPAILMALALVRRRVA